jgi:hypothetical protein
MFDFFPHDRLIEERSSLLRKLEIYEYLKMLESWVDCWSRLQEINRILELNP